MDYQSNLAREYAALVKKFGRNPSSKQQKKLDKLRRLLRQTI